MKKRFVFSCMMILVLVVGAGSVSAFGGQHGKGVGNGQHGEFVQSTHSVCRFVDKDGDGICDNAGTCRHTDKKWNCGFVDANGDGICDNYGTYRHSNYKKNCRFVDKDGDGICDNAGTCRHTDRKWSSGKQQVQQEKWNGNRAGHHLRGGHHGRG